jgi:hypothetical protein
MTYEMLKAPISMSIDFWFSGQNPHALMDFLSITRNLRIDGRRTASTFKTEAEKL